MTFRFLASQRQWVKLANFSSGNGTVVILSVCLSVSLVYLSKRFDISADGLTLPYLVERSLAYFLVLNNNVKYRWVHIGLCSCRLSIRSYICQPSLYFYHPLS